MVRVLGIVNITRDSFSDGGRYLAPDDAVAHALRLVADGADIIDLGAESTHPDAEDVPADVEIARLTPVIERLKALPVPISVDTCKPAVMRHVLRLGVDYLNDVTALRSPEALEALAHALPAAGGTPARLILMHSVAAGARAERVEVDPHTIMDRILAFFDERIRTLTRAGIARQRLILDPGMGFFLGSDPRASLAVLRELPRLLVFELPLLVSTSRKSFIGALLGEHGKSPPLSIRPMNRRDQVGQPLCCGGSGASSCCERGAIPSRPVEQRGAGTLATELWAALRGASYIRTHEVRALRDALRLWQLLQDG